MWILLLIIMSASISLSTPFFTCTFGCGILDFVLSSSTFLILGFFLNEWMKLFSHFCAFPPKLLPFSSMEKLQTAYDIPSVVSGVSYGLKINSVNTAAFNQNLSILRKSGTTHASLRHNFPYTVLFGTYIGKISKSPTLCVRSKMLSPNGFISHCKTDFLCLCIIIITTFYIRVSTF